MSLPESGSNSAVLFGHSGLAMVAAEENAGTVKAGASAATEARTWKRNRRFLMGVLPAPTCNCGEMRTLQAGVVTLRRGRKTRNEIGTRQQLAGGARARYAFIRDPFVSRTCATS